MLTLPLAFAEILALVSPGAILIILFTNPRGCETPRDMYGYLAAEKIWCGGEVGLVYFVLLAFLFGTVIYSVGTLLTATYRWILRKSSNKNFSHFLNKEFMRVWTGHDDSIKHKRAISDFFRSTVIVFFVVLGFDFKYGDCLARLLSVLILTATMTTFLMLRKTDGRASK